MVIMTEFKGDKRTKAYKDWKAGYEKSSKGLGDTVEKITKVTGIKKAVKWVAGDDCLKEEEYNLIADAVKDKKVKFNPVEQEAFKAIYERVFKTKVECTPCSFGKIIWKDLISVFNYYG
jgi:hypothetical protein